MAQEADTAEREEIEKIISDKIQYIGDEIDIANLKSIRENFTKFNKIFMHTKKKVEK